jgi:hypothetical protein
MPTSSLAANASGEGALFESQIRQKNVGSFR